jgi:hypothetical protein
MSKQEEFDNKVRQILNGYEMPPPERIWPDLDNRLSGKKHVVKPVFYLFLPAFFLFSVAAFYYFGSKSPSSKVESEIANQENRKSLLDLISSHDNKISGGKTRDLKTSLTQRNNRSAN